MFGFAHGAVLLAPTEDAFDHGAARLRHAIALMPRGAFVDGAAAALAGFGRAIVLRHMRRDVDGAKMAHMIGGVIGLVRSGGDAAAGLSGFDLEHPLRGAALGGSSGVRTIAVRSLLRRAIGLMRDVDGRWKTIPNVDEVVAVTPAVDDSRSVEVLGFDPKVLITIFDAALAFQLKRYPRLSKKAPIFVSLDKGRRGGATKSISNLKAQAKWSLVLSLDSTTASENFRSDAINGFIERVKREFAELNGVDVSKVRVDFHINA